MKTTAGPPARQAARQPGRGRVLGCRLAADPRPPQHRAQDLLQPGSPHREYPDTFSTSGLTVMLRIATGRRFSQLTEEPTQHADGDHGADATASLTLVIPGRLAVVAVVPGPFTR